MTLEVHEVGPERAGDVLGVIRSAFGDRPPLDPPATAMDETEQTVADALAEHGGLLATHDGLAVATLLFQVEGDLLGLRRVGAVPAGRQVGAARALVRRAEEVATARGLRGLRLMARTELPDTVRFWTRQGYAEAGRDGTSIFLRKLLPVSLTVDDGPAMQDLGRSVAGLLRPGDVVVLTGDLGAGKTTLTQGIGAGLDVRGDVTSPTFVISRVHRPNGDGPALVHVDAYRLGGQADFDDLDLDTDLDTAVTVVEWGEGVAEALDEERLEVALTRDSTGATEVRQVRLTPVGKRWMDTDLAAVLSPVAS